MLDTNALYIIIIILFQAIALVVLFESFHFSSATGYMLPAIERIVPYLSYIVTALTLITILSVSKLSQLAQRKQELEIREINSQHISQLNEALRGQRHDFNNHLQVLHSLVKNRQFPDAARYIEDVIGEAIETNDLLNISNPVIAAIVTSKLQTAKSKGVALEYDLKGDLDKGRVKTIHLSRVLGNLLDNAIEAVEDLEEGSRRVYLQVYGDDSGVFISVKNPGQISPSVLDRLFEPGTSTKKGNNRGMGLNIVKSIADMYNGRVEATSHPENGVRVLVELPR
ncbi:MAG: hypothetical protein HPY66_0685 [Firmicutes bacterium]|nr:hypothetical protein [Bacillota bacterium]